MNDHGQDERSITLIQHLPSTNTYLPVKSASSADATQVLDPPGMNFDGARPLEFVVSLSRLPSAEDQQHQQPIATNCTLPPTRRAHCWVLLVSIVCIYPMKLFIEISIFSPSVQSPSISNKIISMEQSLGQLAWIYSWLRTNNVIRRRKEENNERLVSSFF